MTSQALLYETDVESPKAGYVLNRALEDLEKLDELVQGVWESIVAEKKASPEYQKKMAAFNRGGKKFEQAVKKISKEHNKEVARIEKKAA